MVSQDMANGLSEQLQKCSNDLQVSQQRKVDLKQDIDEWSKQAQALQELANNLSEQLHKCSLELKDAINREAYLTQQRSKRWWPTSKNGTKILPPRRS
jgi:uncharacterized coiled-coil DUF342 family protein